MPSMCTGINTSIGAIHPVLPKVDGSVSKEILVGRKERLADHGYWGRVLLSAPQLSRSPRPEAREGT